MWKRSCRRRCSKIEEKPDKEVQMEVMVAVGKGMENGDVRGINIATGETSQVITSRHFSSLFFTSMSILTSLALIN